MDLKTILIQPLNQLQKLTEAVLEYHGRKQLFSEGLQELTMGFKPQFVIRYAYCSDCFRMAIDTLFADGVLSENEAKAVQPFVCAMAKLLKLIMPHLEDFENASAQDCQRFFALYKNETSAFGYACETTKWAGAELAQKCVSASGDSQILDIYKSMIESVHHGFQFGEIQDRQTSTLLSQFQILFQNDGTKLADCNLGESSQKDQDMSDETINSDFQALEDLLRQGSRREEWIKQNCGRIAIWREKANAGCDKAQVLFGQCFDFGASVEQDRAEAVKWFRLSADQANAQAQFSLGQCFYSGHGVEVDKAEAVKWFRLSADQGLAVAQYSLGICYLFENGVEEDKSEAVRWFRLSAEQGNADAQFLLGECYYLGNGIQGDEAEAVNWLRLAADQENADAQFLLGRCYYFGNGINEDEAESVSWFRLSADQGNASAQHLLGECYYHGTGIEEDESEAVKWFRLAADQGNATAQYRLGQCYECGSGLEEDMKEAIKWFRLAADQGKKEAQFQLGRCYYFGNGINGDEAEAVSWFRLAADQENATAQYMLGQCYYHGTGVEVDEAEAVSWFRLAADQGLASAQLNLGKCYYFGNGIQVDKAEAVNWFRLAADQENATAQYTLGECYYHGTGVEEDETEAVSWFRLAADQGLASAQFQLGECYYHGTGVEEDETEAVSWFRLAADQENTDAQFMLGRCYYFGNGINEDEAEAISWFRLAADQENADAQHMLGECYYHGTGIEEDESEAVKWFRLAADQENAAAQYRLGQCYECGRGLEEDMEEAVKWFRLAAEQGKKEAIEKIDELSLFELLTAERVVQMAMGKAGLSWRDMSKFRSIEDDAAEMIIKKLDINYRTSIDLSGLSEITPSVIKALNKKVFVGNKSSWCTPDLNLNGLKTISAEVAQLLGDRYSNDIRGYKSPGSLDLDGLTELSEDVARSLSQFPGGLSLNGLKQIDDHIAEILLSRKGDLSLDGIEYLNPGFISALSKFKGKAISLSGLKEVPPNAVGNLFVEDRNISISNICVLSPELVTALLNDGSNYSIRFSEVKSISDDVCGVIASYNKIDEDGNHRRFDVRLDGIETLSVFSAAQLAKVHGDLSLNGLSQPSDEVLLELARHEGNLRLEGIEQLSDRGAQILSTHKGALSLRVKELTSTAANFLVKHNGKLNLDLDDLTQEVAEILRLHPSLFKVEVGEEVKLPDSAVEDLKLLGISRIEGSYNGCDDSGSMEFSIHLEESSFTTDDYGGLKGLAEEIAGVLNNENISIDKCREILAGIESLIWSAIPRGWEINSGSIGSVAIDAEEGTVLVEHSWKEEDDDNESGDEDSEEDEEEESDDTEDEDEDSEDVDLDLDTFGNASSIKSLALAGVASKLSPDDLADPDGTFVNCLGMKLLPISPGEFLMGDPEEEHGENAVHRVRITKPYYIGMFAVTQVEFIAVMNENPSYFKGKNRPVEHLSWKEANDFCQRLSELPAEKAAGRKYRLPTEAEWEYACRAGTTTSFSFGDELSHSQANFSNNESEMTPQPTLPVGSFPPNAWGLFDMHGNVWEWCSDWFDDEYYEGSELENPTGPESGTHHTLRGGSASVADFESKVFYRGEAKKDRPRSYDQGGRLRFEVIGDFGVRVVCEIKPG